MIYVVYLCFLLSCSVKSSSSDPFRSHYLCYCMELQVPQVNDLLDFRLMGLKTWCYQLATTFMRLH
jgi:hypothetical protein